ncbi:MAG: DHH family phosphoesterase [Candidatus Heimdallarchaeaceae archaeon]
MSHTFKQIIAFLEQENITRIGIFIHHNADPDAVASAVGLKNLLDFFLSSPHITLFASSLNALTERLCSHFNVSIQFNYDFTGLQAVFLCDTNNLVQLGELTFTSFPSTLPLFIIDHHSYHEFSDKATFSIIDQSVTSTSEIITHIFYSLDVPISSDLCTLLLTGIISDSRRFLTYSSHTFELVQFLTQKGDYEKALSLLVFPISFSERIAKIKGVQRAIIHKREEEIISVSHVSSFESSVARTLVSVGADLAIVISKQKQEQYRISFRSKKSFARNRNINLGEIAYKIASSLGGTGGGHDTAAGINLLPSSDVPQNIENFKIFILDLVFHEIYGD